MTEQNNAPLEKARPIDDDLKVRGVDALRSAKNGWQSIREGNTLTRKQRILKEQENRAHAIRRGENPDQENNWKPGDDDTYAEAPDMRRLMETHKRMQKQNQQKRFFEGTPDLVALKMSQLFENAKRTKPEIVSVEESGFNTYKVIYIAE